MFSSVVWTLIVAVVIAVAVVAVMAARRRPEDGWGTWARENVSAALGGAPGGGTSALAEHRDAADGATVPLSDILADAEEAPGYVTVPEPIEQRIEAIAEPIEQRIGALTERLGERVAARRSAH